MSDVTSCACRGVPQELWSEDDNIVWLPADGRTRSQARYKGYQMLNDACGIGCFYPDEFVTTRDWMRHDERPSGEWDCSWTPCLKTDDGATLFWRIVYTDHQRKWRDGAWRRVKETSRSASPAEPQETP